MKIVVFEHYALILTLQLNSWANSFMHLRWIVLIVLAESSDISNITLGMVSCFA